MATRAAGLTYREQLAAAVRAVGVRGDEGYVWLERARRTVPHSIAGLLDASERRALLVAALRDELYRSFYCHGGPVPSQRGEQPPVAGDSRLVRALSKANCGSGSWEDGWKVESSEGGEIVASTPRLRVRVREDDCRIDGGQADLRLPKELTQRSPGFYLAIGDVTLDQSAERFVRAYWNVTAAGAPALVRELTSRLNAAGTPFRLKVVNHPARFERCDAAVLYLSGPAFMQVRKQICEVAEASRLG
jgi:HopA1 effector protein family